MAPIINNRLRNLLASCAALISLNAIAVGLGDITLHSRIGEPLRAEVPVYVDEAQRIDNACFSLAPLRGSDLPVITSAKTRLVRIGSDYRLIITGSQPIGEPVFVIGLRASCGIELQRDYVLMPAPPLSATDHGQPQTSATVDTPKKAKTANTTEWSAREGETLESIAEAKSNGRISEQRRLLSGLKRANPEIAPEQYLSEGTLINIPNISRRIPAEAPATLPSADISSDTQNTSPPSPRPKKKAKQNTLANLNPTSSDRIVLGGEPEILKPGELAIAPRSELSQMEDRMLKMETTLRTLNQQVDNLNAAIEVSAETFALRQKLQAAQAATPEPPAGLNTPPISAQPPPAPPTPQENNDWANWLELGISALIGGLIASGLAYLLSRPKYQTFGAQAKPAAKRNKHWWRKFRQFKFKPGWRRR
jgi:Tfp pilus assembly protein FimV